MRIYQIKFQSFLLNYSLKINDVEVLFENDNLNSSVDIEVNEWVFLDENILSLDVSQNEEEIPDSARISVQLVVKTDRDSSESQLTEIIVTADTYDQKLILKPFFINYLPFNSPTLDNLLQIDLLDENLAMKFISTFEKYYRLIQNKKIDEVLEYNRYRSEQYEDRYFESPGLRYETLKKSLEQAMSDELLLLRPPNCEKLNLHLYSRLITMDYREENLPIITFIHPEGKYTNSYETYWALNSKEEFFIYR